MVNRIGEAARCPGFYLRAGERGKGKILLTLSPSPLAVIESGWTSLEYSQELPSIMDIFFQSQTWVSLVMLTAMEIVLGIDNLVFLSILSSRLPPARQKPARSIGVFLALIGRLLLLYCVSWLMHLTRPLFYLLGQEFSGRDLILVAGGLFLLAKSTHEIVRRTEHPTTVQTPTAENGTSFAWVLLQILALDLVFSIDSVITAVGMARDFVVMATAMIIAVGVMLISVNKVAEFIDRYPSLRVLALAFLMLIGVMLVADGVGRDIPKGYIYFAMSFSLMVEVINLRKRSRPSSTG
jgi:predicted tellurium resistance membrane protein TerC